MTIPTQTKELLLQLKDRLPPEKRAAFVASVVPRLQELLTSNTAYYTLLGGLTGYLIENARRGFGEDSVIYQLAMLLSALRDFSAGNYTQVVTTVQRVITAMEFHYLADSLTPVQTQAILGASLVRTGRAAEGEPLLRKAYTHGQKLDKVEFVHTVVNLETVLGGCLSAQGRYLEAEPLLLTGHADLEKHLGPQTA